MYLNIFSITEVSNRFTDNHMVARQYYNIHIETLCTTCIMGQWRKHNSILYNLEAWISKVPWLNHFIHSNLKLHALTSKLLTLGFPNIPCPPLAYVGSPEASICGGGGLKRSSLGDPAPYRGDPRGGDRLDSRYEFWPLIWRRSAGKQRHTIHLKFLTFY